MRVGAVARDAVLARTDEREVIVVEPLEERDGFVDVVDAHGGRRILTKLAREVAHSIAHGGPVGDRVAHVVEHVVELHLQTRQHTGIGLTIDRDLHRRDPVTRDLGEIVNLEAAPSQVRSDAVGHERGVAHRDLDHGVRVRRRLDAGHQHHRHRHPRLRPA